MTFSRNDCNDGDDIRRDWDNLGQVSFKINRKEEDSRASIIQWSYILIHKYCVALK